MKKKFVFFAPAKINLFLSVVGKRKDGYHLLQTVFRLINLCDEIQIKIRLDGRIRRIGGPSAIAPGEDLVLRAAFLLKKESGSELGADIELKKIIPIGAGLGGGSSDAATTLLALNRIWKVNFSKSKLLEMAPNLGADVAFFIFGQSAFGKGIGDQLSAISLPPRWYLLATPNLEISTREIFQSFELTPNSKAITIQRFLDGSLTTNDLEELVCESYPIVAKYLHLMRQLGRARLSGTGGTVFCEFDSLKKANLALSKLPKEMKGVVAAGLQKHPMFDI